MTGLSVQLMFLMLTATGMWLTDNTFGDGFDWASAPWFSAEGLRDIGQIHSTVQSLQES